LGLFGSKSKVGIDVGTSSIKIVELEKDGGRFKLINYGMISTEGGGKKFASKDVKVTADDEITWVIQEILKEAKFGTRDAIGAIPSFSTFSTVIKVPFISEDELAKTIPIESRKYIPLPPDEVVLDWSVINIVQGTEAKEGIPATQSEVEVFVAAVPVSETTRYKNILKHAGLNVRALELENSALIRALLGNDQSPTAIVNIGGRSTSILIVDKGIERLNRNYEVGGFELTNAISKALNVNLHRAEELKRTQGLSSGDNVVKEALTSLVDNMVMEARRTINSYQEKSGVKIDKVVAVGGLAKMPGFIEYFGDKLGIFTSMGNPFARVVYDKRLESVVEDIGSAFAVAVGLGMREL
jgi:type IV pilus assembly protein PilM